MSNAQRPVSLGYRVNANELLMDQRVMSGESERYLLGAILMNSVAADIAIEMLSAEDFHLERHQLIFEAIRDLRTRSIPADAAVVSDALRVRNILDRVGGYDYLSELCGGEGIPAGARSYAEIVRGKALLRRIINAGAESQRIALEYAGDPEVAADLSEQVMLDVRKADVKELITAASLVESTLASIAERQMSGGKIIGISTGLERLNRILNGLQGGQMICIGGRTSVGKTSFAVFLLDVIAAILPVLYVSLEMPPRDIFLRDASLISGVPFDRIRRGYFYSKEEAERAVAAVREAGKKTVYFQSAAGLTIQSLRARARRAKRLGVGCIIVDYLQLVDVDARERTGNRVQDVSMVSRGLKNMAMELDIPVVVLSQLSRAADDAPFPVLAHLRESGAIEQDSDVVVFVHRAKAKGYEEPNASPVHETSLIVAKNRNGKANVWIPTSWNSESGRYEEQTEAA